MGELRNGNWHTNLDLATTERGKFVRKESAFRDFVTKDGKNGFKAEPNRYHLYISYACPWACRTLIMCKLKKLETIISYSFVDAYMGENGWSFGLSSEGSNDPILHKKYLYQIYTTANANYSGKVTVPVLWDEERNTIVNNESSEIIRMLNSEFVDYTDVTYDYYPQKLKQKIDEINQVVYNNVNNGVYRCGFAKTQDAYEEAFNNLFGTLDQLEMRLHQHRYLVGDEITEADWRLFTTLVRFDPVYHGHFKCNKKRLIDYPNLWNYLLELYQLPGIQQTVRIDHIKEHYYRSHTTINPYGIIPLGPEINLEAKHNRGKI